ncbi:MAG: hypothetical protein ACREXS_19875 [Gammaproteobacteria bacterium]
MYVRTPEGLGDLSSCPVDLDSAATDLAKTERIRRAIECELRLNFATSIHPGLFQRKQRLKGLFRAVPTGLTSTLQRELEEARTAFAKLFWGRLHRATGRELLGILCQRFFKEYELQFDPASDTFSIDTNPTMTAPDKTQRKLDVTSLIGDAINRPGLLWRRALARVDAALESPSAVPSSLPLPSTPALRDAVKRLSDAQVTLYRESFPDGTGGIDFMAFQSCFERFANGELRDPSLPGHVGFGEPNGGNYFLFGEFAFLCIELKLEEAVWVQALRTFVKTQEIFMHIYREKAVSPPPAVNLLPPTSGAERRDILPVATASDPGFDFSFFRAIGGSVTVGKGQSDFQRKMALRAKYDGMDVSALQVAARDNLSRALRMP